MSLQVQPRLTKRAVDGGDSAAFSGFFYTQTESCSWSFIHARPTATNANRWHALLVVVLENIFSSMSFQITNRYLIKIAWKYESVFTTHNVL